ncbi:Homeobox-leucine zipper protein HAT5 [Sesamum angolense]|uniref:Homeobox-leucine zipper protein HAT5 n=1 Tax=Sesamum angolense TaxID=2727404 RepID=A0AAE2BPG0_9LAMI|nr:Homeobox-leucine zipper protein HAT5 [Sesamum angolense]
MMGFCICPLGTPARLLCIEISTALYQSFRENYIRIHTRACVCGCVAIGLITGRRRESGRIYFDPTSCQTLFLGNGDSGFRGARSVMSMDEGSKKRPFFSTPEDLYDEEYFDEQLPEKKRRLTPEQLLSLTDKLQPKEPAGDCQKSDPLPADVPPCLELTVKAEDRLSTGSDNSVVVDDDGRQLLDSVDSYFPNNGYPSCVAIHSEEDAGSDDGGSYFSDVFAAAAEEQQEQMGWCIWS